VVSPLPLCTPKSQQADRGVSGRGPLSGSTCGLAARPARVADWLGALWAQRCRSSAPTTHGGRTRPGGTTSGGGATTAATMGTLASSARRGSARWTNERAPPHTPRASSFRCSASENRQLHRNSVAFRVSARASSFQRAPPRYLVISPEVARTMGLFEKLKRRRRLRAEKKREAANEAPTPPPPRPSSPKHPKLHAPSSLNLPRRAGAGAAARPLRGGRAGILGAHASLR
jgi:hypothetical protein